MSNLTTTERLLGALAEQDLDVFVSLLDPEIEVEGLKGTFRGHDQVRRWATASPEGNLYSRVVVDDVREVGDSYVAIDARRQWFWREDDELAEESRFGSLLRLRDAKVVEWRLGFPSIVEAIEAVPTPNS